MHLHFTIKDKNILTLKLVGITAKSKLRHDRY